MFKPKTAADVSSENENHHHHRHGTAVFNNIQTQFSNFVRGLIPKKSMASREIRDRFNRIPIYTVPNIAYPRGVKFCLFSESDARDLWDAYDFKGFVDQVPLSEILDYHPVRDPPAVRLVPEKSQVYNAIKLKEIQHKHSSDFGDVNIFSGVPVFQSQVFNAILDENPNNDGPRAFFRKEDLEKSLDEVIGSNRTTNDKDIIQVAALEDIIKEMKDSSTSSKWKHVVFMPPGVKFTNNQTLDLDISSNQERII